jgi:membrane protein insertase Oxa1/YidC/SpoIIIJ
MTKMDKLFKIILTTAIVMNLTIASGLYMYSTSSDYPI